MDKIEVSAAILMNNGQILCMQRGEDKYDYISYKYEFPGGKLERNENRIDALKRELFEEMKIKVSDSDLEYFMTVNHEYPDFQITMHSYICEIEDRHFNRVEHINHIWSDVESLDSLDWAEADWPIVRRLMENK